MGRESTLITVGGMESNRRNTLSIAEGTKEESGVLSTALLFGLCQCRFS